MTVSYPRSVASAACLLVLSMASSAMAQLRQPNGTVIPQGNNLVNALNAEGESINPLTDAAITPETFTPKCELTFKVIARGAGQRNSFGWYNVDPNRVTPPPLSELYEFIRCSDGVGTERTLDLRNDVRYLGGEIAFFQATTEGRTGSGLFCGSNCGPNCVDFNNPGGTLGYVFYSEIRYNPDNAGTPTIHLLTMDSRVYPNAFYFGWEDLYAGGDNDFEDLLMRVEGVQCSGGGTACETGQQGVCADGVMQCRNGVLQCIGVRESGPETCNALDDDCDGESDEGDGLCPSGQVCDRGTCIGSCGLDSFCPPGLECTDSGRCVDVACLNVDCDPGFVCDGGTCRQACEGVVCPFGQHCRSGLCVEQCLGGCEAGQVCDEGICISCDCDRCGGDRVCAPAMGMCVEPACSMMTCDIGTHCEAGICVDDCAGVVCPRGSMCDAGQCVAETTGGTGGTSGAGGLGGSGGAAGFSGFGGFGGTSGTGGASGVGGFAGAGAGSGLAGTTGSVQDPGCACQTVGGSNGRSLNIGWLMFGIAAWGVSKRRRRSAR